MSEHTAEIQSEAPHTLNPILSGTIWKELLRFAWPLILSSVFQQLYSTADLLIVGKFSGHEAMAAIGSTNSLSILLLGLFLGLSVGASIVYSQFFGAQDFKGLHRTVGTAFVIAAAGGVLLTVVGLLLARPLLQLMDTPADILDLATLYMRIIFIGMIPQMIYNISSGIIRAKGNSRTPLRILTISCVMNIVLDLVFVAGLGWSVDGAAWATVISQLVSAFLSSRVIFKADLAQYPGLTGITFSARLLKRMLRMGIPAGLQTVVVSFSNVLLQTKINAFGSTAVAGTAAANKIDGFLFMIIDAFGIAITTFVAQNIGAGKKTRAVQASKTCLLISCVAAVVLGLVFLLISEPLLSLFNAGPEVLSYGKRMMSVICPTYWIFAIFATLSGSLRGSGNTLVPMIVALVCLCVVRLAWVFSILPMFENIDIVYYSYPVSWIFAAGSIAVFTYKRFFKDNLSPAKVS